jgi:mono/diheme cytochrome c family protein/glucose/arabinose dehydrogenase
MKHSIALIAVAAAAVVTSSVHGARQSPPPSSSSSSPAAADAPVLSPAEALKTFALPPGYRLELVASEPLIQDPVAIDWDADGRMWAIEMPGYMLDMQARNELDPTGRVVVFEDANGDGTLDRRTVFADGLVLPRALKVVDRGVLVGEPPNLWLMQDADGDLRMDGKTLVTDRYGRRDANVEHNANSLLWALDNRLHTSEVDTYFRFTAGRFEVLRTLARGQWGATQDDAGRIYRNTNSSALHVDLVPTPYFARQGTMARTRGSYEFLGGPGGDLNETWPARPTPGVNRGYQTGVLRDDGRLASFTAVAAPTVYRGDRLPSELQGSVFVVEPSGNLVSRIIVSDDGRTLRGRKAYDRREFLTSTDERFRPVNLSSAPDGTLYVVDMYRGIIQHKGYITEYLRDQILARNLEQPTARGRIYRVVHETTRRDRRPSLSRLEASQLIDLLSHPNGWWRDTAQQLLVQRNPAAAVAPLTRLAATAPAPRTRLHALWTLDGMDRIEAASVMKALSDPAREVRVSALRLSERWLREPGHPIAAAARTLASDPDWWVRQQLAASLGELPRGAREPALVSLLEAYANDPVVTDAAISGLRGSETVVLEALLASAADTPPRSAAITMLAATIVAAGQDDVIQPLLARIADDAGPAWQRSALLRGVEVTVLGATAPGSPAGRGRGAGAPGADPAAPGARGGPGGAPAFPGGRAEATGENGVTPAAGGRRGRPPLKLSREPALVALSARNGGDLSARATSLLARIEWPGKPGAAPAAAPLTADEQARYDTGRGIYESLCVACHQADGRGLDKVAPSLIGSELAVAPPDVPVRILLNGKEGTVGLMPPLGSVLSDDQIAAVLTYVRRQWGNAGTPVAGADVGRIRPLTTGRTRPWTDADLARIGGGR